jgi:hypothetical protein
VAVNVKQALARLQAPDERAAQARTWEVVSHAYRERPPAIRRRSRRRLAFAPVLIALVAALTLTPAGATVSRLLRHALGVPHAARALHPLPAPGTLLVSGPNGTWTVSADSSRRRLGSWPQASWSPHGLYIAVAGGGTLAAIDPRGVTQWALARRAVSDPRWYPPTGFRVAYRSGSTLRVVAGDGTDDHLLAGDVAPVAPAWRPDHPYQLAYVQRRRVVLRDADSRQVIWIRPAGSVRKLGWSADGSRLLILGRGSARVLTPTGKTVATITSTPAAPVLDGSLSPDGRQLALVRGGAGQGVLLAQLNSPRPPLRGVLSGPAIQQVDWSPNSRWLLVSWPAADQWVFVAVHGAPRIAAVSGIARQFTTRSAGRGFPRLDGWCCTARGPAG